MPHGAVAQLDGALPQRGDDGIGRQARRGSAGDGEFRRSFARRHEAAFAALHERLDFDYYSIDCAETRDGRLLVFEADTAAIIHLMDPPDLFPYKPAQMRRVFAAFDGLLRRAAARADSRSVYQSTAED